MNLFIAFGTVPVFRILFSKKIKDKFLFNQQSTFN